MAERFPPELLKGTTELVVLAVLARDVEGSVGSNGTS